MWLSLMRLPGCACSSAYSSPPSQNSRMKCRWLSVLIVAYSVARKGWSTVPRMRSSVSTRVTLLRSSISAFSSVFIAYLRGRASGPQRRPSTRAAPQHASGASYHAHGALRCGLVCMTLSRFSASSHLRRHHRIAGHPARRCSARARRAAVHSANRPLQPLAARAGARARRGASRGAAPGRARWRAAEQARARPHRGRRGTGCAACNVRRLLPPAASQLRLGSSCTAVDPAACPGVAWPYLDSVGQCSGVCG